MKKVLLIFLSFIFVVNLNAQFIKNYGVKFGVATSQQFTRYHLPEEPPIDPISISGPHESLLGMTVGVNVEFIDYPPFNLVFECNYVQKGYRDKSVLEWNDGANHIYTSKFHYLNISLLTKTKIVIETISPYILAGPRLDIEIAYEDSEYEKYNNKIIPGFVIGVGSEIILYKIKLLAEAIYDFNLGKIHEDTYETVSYQSYVFRLGILL